MLIAVTGALGRLGREVSEAVVAAGHTVRRIDVIPTPGLDCVADLRNRDAALDSLVGADAVIHLAAHPKPIAGAPGKVYVENTTMAFHVLSAGAELGIAKTVAASSINAIGGEFSEIDHYQRFPVDLREPSRARDEYSLSKWVLEEQVRAFGRSRGDACSYVCLRIHAVQTRELQRAVYDRNPACGRRNLWGYSPPKETAAALVRACEVPLPGVHIAYLAAHENAMLADPRELVRPFWPDTPMAEHLSGTSGFFDLSFAEVELGWDA